MIFTLPILQKTFNEAEKKINVKTEGLPIFGEYKTFLQAIMNIDDVVFEMLYDEDTENRDEYDIQAEELLEAYKKLEEIRTAG
ncbi:hypothetical protein [Staphylococcus capitis]|uniref:Phage protein n=1 Tax=Staphylococcus capitis TaxID=29388 RepID=A0ABX1SNY8_STACP|nr:hypothetical protein [Staphylococcus capitis]NMK54020.1 hypothetical protein [Staphylococcus capitis]NMK69288.1 hypothetical protein [Staphylococcus capitis]